MTISPIGDFWEGDVYVDAFGVEHIDNSPVKTGNNILRFFSTPRRQFAQANFFVTWYTRGIKTVAIKGGLNVL